MTGNERITIRRAPHDSENPYFMMRRDSAQDRRMSFDARGVLAYLLSKPLDWTLTIPDLMSEGDIGRDKVYGILREMIAAGYAERVGVRNAGKWAGIEYHIHESPIAPLTENPDTEKPYTENPQLQSKESHKRKKNLPASGDAGAGSPKAGKAARKTSSTGLSKEALNELWDAVAAAWNETNAGIIANYRGMLFGVTTVRGEWKTYQPTPPLTLDEFKRFETYAKARMKEINGKSDMPDSLKTLATWITDFRAQGNPHAAPAQTVSSANGIDQDAYTTIPMTLNRYVRTGQSEKEDHDGRSAE